MGPAMRMKLWRLSSASRRKGGKLDSAEARDRILACRGPSQMQQHESHSTSRTVMC